MFKQKYSKNRRKKCQVLVLREEGRTDGLLFRVKQNKNRRGKTPSSGEVRQGTSYDVLEQDRE